MADFKKTTATAKAKVAQAEIEAFKARLEAIEEILQGAPPLDVLTLCARAVGRSRPDLLRCPRRRIRGGISAGFGRVHYRRPASGRSRG
jgi:hypothetical protein